MHVTLCERLPERLRVGVRERAQVLGQVDQSLVVIEAIEPPHQLVDICHPSIVSPGAITKLHYTAPPWKT
jgi:hypothetical protein